MNNHFHLLVHQDETGIMSAFMRSLMTSYSRYFNLKYKRTGPLFESRYKASQISQQAYLEHISRYIHLNPRYWLRYEHSSLKYYLETHKQPEWLNASEVLGLFASPQAYLTFLEDYEEHKQMLAEIKHELAN
jgi:putative transposase